MADFESFMLELVSQGRETRYWSLPVNKPLPEPSISDIQSDPTTKQTMVDLYYLYSLNDI